MAKGQKRSNREAKKPKQPKSMKSAASSPTLIAGLAPRDGSPGGGRDRPAPRNGRR